MTNKLKIRRRKKIKPKKKRKLIKRHSFTDMDDERYVLAFMLMNSDVMDAAYQYYSDGQLQLRYISELYKRQYKSVFDYYEAYKEAPKRTIKYIQEGQKAKLTTDEIDVDRRVLKLVAAEYLYGKEGYETNPEYIAEVVLPRLIRTRKIQSINAQIVQAIDSGYYDKAENLISKYETVSSKPPDYTYGFQPVLTSDYYDEFQNRKKELGEIVFRFDKSFGDISLLIPPLRKQWLVSLIGNTKSGKSYLLWRMAMDAALNQNKKVLFLSPEMPEFDMVEERTMPFITGRPRRPFGVKARFASYWVPAIDCLLNQTGNCPHHRLNKRIIFDMEFVNAVKKGFENPITARFTKWNLPKQSKRCQKECFNREPTKRDKRKFVPSVYFKYLTRQRYLSDMYIKRTLKSIKYHNASNLKVKFFPKYSATISQQLNDIRRYMDRNNWVPDIVFWDYLDISKLDLIREQKRWEAIDNIWKLASSFSQEVNALGISAEQSTQVGRSKRLLDETITSEASMKDHHIDLKIGIIKHLEETMNNICRVNIIYDRHNAFDRKNEVLVTQNLHIGDAITDSVFWRNTNMPPYPISLPVDQP